MPKRVERTRCGGTWTEARYFGFIRSALRAAFIKYPVKSHVKASVKEMTDDGARWRGASCDGLFLSKDTQVDHIVPCGSLRTYDDLPGFVERMFCEAEGFQVLCKACHQDKTNAERAARKHT